MEPFKLIIVFMLIFTILTAKTYQVIFYDKFLNNDNNLMIGKSNNGTASSSPNLNLYKKSKTTKLLVFFSNNQSNNNKKKQKQLKIKGVNSFCWHQSCKDGQICTIVDRNKVNSKPIYKCQNIKNYIFNI
jgi:hypothetical protein